MALSVDRQRYLKAKEAGLCVTCRKLPKSETSLKCLSCKTRHKEIEKKWREKNQQENRCTTCGSLENLVEEKQTRRRKYKFCETCYLKKLSREHLGTTEAWVFLKQKLENQNYRCAYIGEFLVLGNNASVDHILPRIRFPEHKFSKDNVAWTTLDVNLAKRNFTKEEFLSMINAIKGYLL